MSEHNFEAVPVIVEYQCDECSQGYMYLDAEVKPNWQSPTPYPHKCLHCGYQQSFKFNYPIHGMKHATPPKVMP